MQPPQPPSLKRFPPDELWEAVKYVDLVRRNLRRDRDRVLWLTQPATFFDPSKVPGRHRNALFRGLISIAVVSDSRDSNLICAVLDQRTRGVRETQKALEALNVPTLVCDLLETSLIRDFLTKLDWIAVESKRKVTDPSERGLLTLAKQSLGVWYSSGLFTSLRSQGVNESIIQQIVARREHSQKQFLVSHEVALSEIVEIPGIETDEHAQEQNETLQNWPTYRADIVLSHLRGDHKAFMVIEVDGSIHYDESKASSDRRRDDVLVASGLVVLRINTSNFPSTNTGRHSRINKKNRTLAEQFRHNFVTDFLSLITETLAPKDHDSYIHVLKQTYNETLKSLKKSGRILSEEEKCTLLSALFDSFASHPESPDQVFSDESIALGNATDIGLERLLFEHVSGSQVNEFTINAVDSWKGHTLQAHATVVNSSGVTVVHDSPKVYVSLRLPENWPYRIDASSLLSHAFGVAFLSSISA